jgi:hypothetical protein
MEKKKGVVKTAGTGIKRPAVVTEEPRKKVALPQKPTLAKPKPLITTASAIGTGNSTGLSKPKLPIPTKDIKNPILINLQKPTTLVDSNGDILGLNEYFIINP